MTGEPQPYDLDAVLRQSGDIVTDEELAYVKQRPDEYRVLAIIGAERIMQRRRADITTLLFVGALIAAMAAYPFTTEPIGDLRITAIATTAVLGIAGLIAWSLLNIAAMDRIKARLEAP